MTSANREGRGCAPASARDAPAISVVVATYKRLDQLAACLDGIEAQTRRADEVLVVTHCDPHSVEYILTRALAWPALKLVEADRPGSVAAYNAGLAATKMPFVAYVDDDAVPAPDWLERILATFARDPMIAAVGGRDVIVTEAASGALPGSPRRPPKVGRIQWFGRMTANHHIGSGPPRDVDVLKGVNMSFRRAAVVGHGFDERLRGPGAVVHSELSICLPLRKQGLRIIYDPQILVTHDPAPRPAGDRRASLTAEATFNATHNESMQILDYLRPTQRLVFVIWWAVIGSTESPGLAVLVRDLIKGKPQAGVRFLAAQRGRLAARHGWRLPRQTLDRPTPTDGRSAAGPGGAGRPVLRATAAGEREDGAIAGR